MLVPRETPLSSIHLRGLATLNDAGAVILFAAPGFYHGADTVQDLVDFVVARCLDQLGRRQRIDRGGGASTFSLRPHVPERARDVRVRHLAPDEVRRHVRPDRAGLRRR